MDGLAEEFTVADFLFVALAAFGVFVDIPEVYIFGGGLVWMNGAR